ncbi:hypothetical protein G7067_06805 [Leucobacter insecticola]|uniref:Solute-binding protein family 5 domain-containing protein n=1 Tax=Leucobacter insecticola TaxID=2714934 RepID=A0A6G8FLR8_9MICO|nr:hypothetical protein G7067_06805 [Leucobacter insecticola]
MSGSVAAVALAALALTGCSSSDNSDLNSDGAGPLNIGGFTDVTSWDPALADIGFDGPFLSAVYDPLIALDGDGTPVPALAKEWEVSEDFKTITLKLRDDAVFSDGEAFNSAAAVKALDHLKSGVRSQEAYLNVESFEATDDSTVEIHLSKRDDTILYYMGLGRSYMPAPAAIDAGTLTKAPVGSGPYTLDEKTSVAGAEYHFQKVADHWAADQFAFDPLTIMPIDDPTARTNAMIAGQINVNYAGPDDLAQAKANNWNVESKIAGRIGIQFTDRTGASFAPFGDVRVRQALNYAFDSAGLIDMLAQGNGKLTNQVFPSGGEGNLPELDHKYDYNIKTAKELMAEAGYADGFDITMPIMPVLSAYQPIANQVFADLGIRASWDEMQYIDYAEKAPTYPAFMGMIAIDSNPVANVERQIEKPQWYNLTPNADKFPEVQAAIDEVHSSDPGPEQVKAIEKLNTIVTDLAWFDVWFQSENSYVSTPNIDVTAITGMMFPTLRQIVPANPSK